MKKIIAIAVMAVMCLMTLVSCNGGAADPSSTAGSASDFDYIKNKGTMVIGITDFEPMDFQVDGKWTGFDAELAEMVCNELGVTAEFQLINWKSKETELAAKTIDCIWNGLTWNEERAANMSMTDYYMKNRQVVVVKADDAAKLGTVDALNKVSVAAESGSAGEGYIKNNLTSATYIEKDSQLDVLTELVAGTVDAGVIDYIMAYYLINKEGSNFSSLKILDGAISTDDEFYSIAFRKGSDVTAKVNGILKDLKAAGKVDTLAEKYSLKDALVK